MSRIRVPHVRDVRMREVRAPETVAEWIARWGRDHGSVAEPNDRALGLVAFLLADLERDAHLSEPHPDLIRALNVELRTVPMEYAFVSASSPFYRWMQLSALAEQLAQPQLATLVLDLVTERLPVGEDAAESEALCWCRRGRIARVLGDLHDAETWYRSAIDRVRGRPWRDARPRAELGLATLAGVRGNYPEVRVGVQRVLTHRPRVHAMHRIVAYQLSAIARRKAHDFLGSLLDNWRAFDLTAPEDPSRDELVLVMAETALELGDPDAAYRAFDSLRNHTLPLRLEASMHIGLLRAALRLDASGVPDELSRRKMLAMEAAVQTLTTRPLGPQDLARALLSLIEAAIQRRDMAAARHRVTQVEALVAQHGYHEYSHRLGQLVAEIEVLSGACLSGARPPVTAIAPTGLRGASNNKALVRLRRLTCVRRNTPLSGQI
ncbi:MAG: hypothetical protein V4617_07710 [Gemmatimonadota bacterium]